MSQDFELLEELQENFADQYGLTIILTDRNGEPVTPIKGENELCKQFIHQEEGNLFVQIKESMKKEWSITMPLIYELYPGIHVIISPVENGKGSPFFLWTGMMVEEQTKHLVKDQLHHIYGGKEARWDEVIENTPIIQLQSKQKWLQRAGQTARLMSLCLKDSPSHGSHDIQAKLFRESVQTGKDLQQQLSHLLTNSEEYEFLGLAEKQEEDQYKITHVAGEEVESIQGACFSPGEGFLGRVLLTGEHAYWGSIEKDPRTYFFQRYQFHPKSLFCFPVKRHDGSLSLLFGGSISHSEISREGRELGETFASILEVSLLTNTLRTENSDQLNRLSSLVEICKLMAATPDLKRILYILVDISINLVEGPFSCVILKEPESEKIQLVSRGKMEAEDYIRDVVARHYERDIDHSSADPVLPEVHETTWGSQVVECPLLYREGLLGVLCVGTQSLPHTQLKEHIAFLHTLSIIGGVSLQLAKQEDEGFSLGQVEALHRAVGQFDAEAHSQSAEAAKIAGEFMLQLGLPASLVKDIINACLLSFYSPEFIREVFPNSRMTTIVEEGKSLRRENDFEGWNEASVGSQIFALATSYVGGRELETIQHDDQGVFQKFLSYLQETQIVEQELIFTEEAQSVKGLEPVASNIKEQVNLSPREQEVLELVIRGMNNREIAEELYISNHTVKNHVTKIFQKLEVPDRAHAISKVYQLKYGS